MGKPDAITRAAICAQYGILNALKCSEALEYIIDLMKPYETELFFWNQRVSAIISMPETITTYLRDVRNHEAVRRTASKIWDWVGDGSRVAPTDVFSALQSDFRAVGFSEADAYERTWQTLGIYATRGANIGELVFHFMHGLGDAEAVAGSFAILGHGMGVLDARALKQGLPMFSFPKNIETEIDTSKPYYFWLTAYLAREASRKFGSIEGAMDAVWISQLGYQMKSTTNGRDPVRAFIVDPFDPANNKIRMDLAYAAAGSVYGARSVKSAFSGRFSINDGFRELLEKGDPLEKLSEAEANALWAGMGKDGFFRWKRIFNPDVVMDLYQR
jgi:hypothetical protein